MSQIIAIITPYLVDKQYANLSSKIFFMWGSLCIISVAFAYFLVPETKGLSLEQVDRMAGVETPKVYDRQAAKESLLHSFGSNKDEKDFVHIPIEQAMKLLESKRLENNQWENKLPVRAAPPADQAWRQEGLYDSGESNSGREFRGKPR